MYYKVKKAKCRPLFLLCYLVNKKGEVRGIYLFACIGMKLLWRYMQETNNSAYLKAEKYRGDTHR